jgi:hypothetical protein
MPNGKSPPLGEKQRPRVGTEGAANNITNATTIDQAGDKIPEARGANPFRRTHGRERHRPTPLIIRPASTARHEHVDDGSGWCTVCQESIAWLRRNQSGRP